jgi:TP901 family phage tail tape measure protein
MASTAAVLNILVTANTKQATAALAKTQAQLGATAATANKSATGMGATMAKGAKVGGLAVAALGAMSIKAAADWEDAFAGVRKTVNASDKEFAKMEQGLRGLAKTMPITATEVADLAAEAGALGIKSKDIVKFTKVAAMLGEATDMSANDAANGLARLSNVMGTSSKDFERLGSTLVALGNKGASTEAEILSMAQRMAGAAKIIGLTEAEVLSMSSALASVGIRAEMGGSAISRVWLQIDDAIAKGSSQLESFARIAGMSEANFRKLFAEDANAAVIRYAAGLKTAHDQGQSVSQMLEEVDLNEIRVRETLLKSSAAQKLLTQAQEQGNRAWEKNNALNQEAQTRFKTVASQASILKNRITDLFISLGQKLEPATRAVLETLNRLASGKLPKWFQDIIDKSAPLRAAISALGGMFGKVFGGIENILSGMVKAVKGAFNVLAGILTGDWARAWQGVKDVVRGAIEGVIGIVKTLTAPVRAVAETVAGLLKGAFEGLLEVGRRVIDALLGVVTTMLDKVASAADLFSKIPGPLGNAFDEIQTAAEDTSDSINHLRERIRGTSPVVDKARQDWVTGWRAIAQNAAEKAGITWKVWRDALNRTAATGKTKGDALADALNDAYREASRGADKHGGDAFKYWRDWLGKTNDEARDKGGKFVSILGGSFQSASKASRQGLAHLAVETNKALKSLGGGKKDMYVANTEGGGGGGATLAQKGAIVPGAGSGDKVPLHLDGKLAAMVEPGELVSVANKRATAAIMDVNKRVPRFAGGGSIDVDGAQPGFVPFMNYLNSLFGPLYVMSGLRPGSITTSGNVSNHASGRAVDISTPGIEGATSAATLNATGEKAQRMDALHSFMSKHFPLSTVPGDFLWRTLTGGNHYNHIHRGITNNLATDPAAMRAYISKLPEGGAFGGLKKIVIEGPDGLLKDIAQRAVDKVHTAASAFMSRQADTPMFGSGPIQGVPHSMGRFMSSAYGPPWNAMNGTGVTATGVDLVSGPKAYGVAVDPSVIPLGSNLAIQPNPFGYDGAFKAFDTGGAIQGKRIDFYDWRGRDEQLAWGMRPVEVGMAKHGGIVAKLAGGGTISIGGATSTTTIGTATSVPPPGGSGYGYTVIPPEYEATMQRFRDQYAQYMEHIENAQDSFALSGSAFGTGLSESERKWMLALSQERYNVGQSLLSHLVYARSWGGYDDDTMAEFYSQITDLQGITGSGGSLAGDRRRIAEYQQPSDQALALPQNVRDLINRRAYIEEQIELAEGRFGRVSSPWGEAMAPAERDVLLGRYQALLKTLQQTWYGLTSEVGRLKGFPGTQDTIEDYRDQIRELVGRTGQGGSIGATKTKIADLKEMDFTQALREQKLLTLQKNLALATRTPGMEDDITAQGRIVGHYRYWFQRALASGNAAEITQMANDLSNAEETWRDMKLDNTLGGFEKNLALAALTPDLADDIAAQQQVASFWQRRLDNLLGSGTATNAQITEAAQNLKSARDSLSSMRGEGDDGLSAELLRTLLQQANIRTAVSQAQYGVLDQFQQGTGFVPQTGPYMLHRGEAVIPANQNAEVVVYVNGDIVNVPSGRSPVEVEGAKAIVQRGSRGYGRRPLPGAVGR